MKFVGILNFVFTAVGSYGHAQSLELNTQIFDIHDCSAVDTLSNAQDSLLEHEKRCNHFYIEWPNIKGEDPWINQRIEKTLKEYICGLIQSDQLDSAQYTQNLTEAFVLKHNKNTSAEWDITCEYIGTFKNVHQFSISHGGYYYGAAHGFGYSQYFHLHSITAHEIELVHLFNELELVKLESYTLAKMISEQDGIWLADLNDSFFLSENFIMNESGITFYYNAYDIGPYAMGYPEIALTWSEIQTCLSN